MKKVTLNTCGSCKGKSDALKKIKGVDKVESESSGLVVIGKFDVDDVVKVMNCHHSVLRSIENNYEAPKKKDDDKKKDEKKDGGSGAVYVYAHTYNHYSK